MQRKSPNKEIQNLLDSFSKVKKRNFFNLFKNRTICFCGHRDKFLPAQNTSSFLEIKNKLKDIIIESINNGYTYFISGLAQGIDLLCAEIILNLKLTFPEILLECAIPHIKQSENYTTNDKERYLEIIKKADFITIINQNYSSNCMMERNKFMVNNSSLVIGVWNGNKSGTYNTIAYAEKKGVPCKLIMI